NHKVTLNNQFPKSSLNLVSSMNTNERTLSDDVLAKFMNDLSPRLYILNKLILAKLKISMVTVSWNLTLIRSTNMVVYSFEWGIYAILILLDYYYLSHKFGRP